MKRVHFAPASNSNGYLPISDTGVLFIYPKKEATGIINDVDKLGKTKFGVAGSMDINGGIRGVVGDGIAYNMKDGYWLLVKEGSSSGDPDDEGLGNDMFYDGLFQHDGNSKEENMKQYGNALLSLEDVS